MKIIIDRINFQKHSELNTQFNPPVKKYIRIHADRRAAVEKKQNCTGIVCIFRRKTHICHIDEDAHERASF